MKTSYTVDVSISKFCVDVSSIWEQFVLCFNLFLLLMFVRLRRVVTTFLVHGSPLTACVSVMWRHSDHPWRWVQGGGRGEQMRGQERFSSGSPSTPPPAFHFNLMIMIFAEDDLCLHSVITQPASMISAIGNRWAIRGAHQALLLSLLAFCYSAITFNTLVTFLLHVFPNLLHGDCCQCG